MGLYSVSRITTIWCNDFVFSIIAYFTLQSIACVFFAYFPLVRNRYSGNLRDIGGSIDDMADLTWEKVHHSHFSICRCIVTLNIYDQFENRFQFQLLKPIYKGCMEKGIQQVSIQVAENALGPTTHTTTSTRHSKKSNSMQQNGKVRKRS